MENGAESGVQLQAVHSKYIADPNYLSKLLKEYYGPGNYSVEVSLADRAMSLGL